jgi:hypothetical protein
LPGWVGRCTDGPVPLPTTKLAAVTLGGHDKAPADFCRRRSSVPWIPKRRLCFELAELLEMLVDEFSLLDKRLIVRRDLILIDGGR